jgi:hypothetical protein
MNLNNNYFQVFTNILNNLLRTISKQISKFIQWFKIGVVILDKATLKLNNNKAALFTNIHE